MQDQDWSPIVVEDIKGSMDFHRVGKSGGCQESEEGKYFYLFLYL